MKIMSDDDKSEDDAEERKGIGKFQMEAFVSAKEVNYTVYANMPSNDTIYFPVTRGFISVSLRLSELVPALGKSLDALNALYENQNGQLRGLKEEGKQGLANLLGKPVIFKTRLRGKAQVLSETYTPK